MNTKETSFTLRDLFEVYHEKCRELDEIKRINDLLIEQNEKLIESNYESEKVKDLEYKITRINVRLSRQTDYSEVLEQRLNASQNRVKELEDWINPPKNFAVSRNDSNRFEPSPHVRWDDYNTGG